MSVSAPHFMLFAHATGNAVVGAGTANSNEAEVGAAETGGKWRFVIQSPDGKTVLDAEDEEAGDSRERLELLAIVRGLEALDQRSQVTLVTHSRAISRGLSEGLNQWRENDWQWERFGTLTPIKNRDLWQRVDQALSIHQVTCRLVSGGGSDDLNLSAGFSPSQSPQPKTRRVRGRQLRFDPSTSAEASPATNTPPKRPRARQPADASSLWQRTISGVRQLFSR